MFLLGIFLLNFQWQAKADCVSDFTQDLDRQVAALNKKYHSIDSQFDRISNAEKPNFLRGSSDQLVLLTHGFMGSPDEMQGIATRLNALGFNTYSALIPGFGATPEVANAYGANAWVRWYNKEISRAESCFSKVHLVGFSTGASLATHFIETHPNDGQITSAILLSPYYKTHSLFYELLVGGGGDIFNQISVETLFYVMRFPDVEVMLKKPLTYLQAAPTLAAQQIQELGQQIQDLSISSKPLEIPSLVFVSDDDKVVEQKTSIDVTAKLFAKRELQEYHTALLENRVPHHLMVKEVSPVAKDVEDQIVKFFNSHNSD